MCWQFFYTAQKKEAQNVRVMIDRCGHWLLFQRGLWPLPCLPVCSRGLVTAVMMNDGHCGAHKVNSVFRSSDVTNTCTDTIDTHTHLKHTVDFLVQATKLLVVERSGLRVKVCLRISSQTASLSLNPQTSHCDLLTPQHSTLQDTDKTSELHTARSPENPRSNNLGFNTPLFSYSVCYVRTSGALLNSNTQLKMLTASWW